VELQLLLVSEVRSRTCVSDMSNNDDYSSYDPNSSSPETDDPTIVLHSDSLEVQMSILEGDNGHTHRDDKSNGTEKGDPDDAQSEECKNLLNQYEKEISEKWEAEPLTKSSQEKFDHPGEGSFYLTKEVEEEVLGPETYTLCGIGILRNGWLQKLARPEVYLLAFSITGITQGMNFSYAGGTMTTIQRRFGLSSKTSGFITIGNDLFEIFLSVYIAYFAGNGHRPRWIAAGILLAIISCFIFISPHWLFGAGDFVELEKKSATDLIIGINQTDTRKADIWQDGCKSTISEDQCVEEVNSGSFSNEQYAVIILQFLAMVLLGLVTSLYYSVGYSYLDDAVPKNKIPLYFSVAGTLRIFGPVSGLALSSWSLRKWIDPTASTSISPKSPNWVGAWWLGYWIIAASMVVPMCMMMMMPRQLPSTRKRQTDKLRAAAKQGHKVYEEYAKQLRPTHAPTFKDMLPGLKRLSKNRIFVCIIMNQFFFWGSIVGVFIFSTKYVENQFRVSAADANQYTAVISLLASVTGFLGTGSFLSWFQPKTKAVLISTLIISIGLIVSYLSQFLVNCNWGEIYGLENILDNDNLKTSPQTSLQKCMSDCNCGDQFMPVCVSHNYTYYSACHAGCTSSTTFNKITEYSNCSCVEHIIEDTNKISHPVVQEGLCDEGCNGFYIYLVISFFNQFFIAANRAIANIIFFRSVNERDKDLALGLLNVILSFSFTVCPTIIGTLIDQSCELWKESCGRRGHCIIYNNNTFRFFLYGLPIVGVTLGFFMELLLLRWSDDIDFFGEKEKELLGIMSLKDKKDIDEKEK
ncbi:unnamed protein product, partial [Meganyctiphanes norvegica]